MSVGDKIAELRRERGWTQAFFGEKIGYHGRHVSRWERNTSRPSVKALRRIAEIFGIEVDDLLDARAPQQIVTQDRDLLEKVQQLERLDADGRAMVFRLINLLSMENNMARMVLENRAVAKAGSHN